MSFLSGLELLTTEEIARHTLIVRHLTVTNLLRHKATQTLAQFKANLKNRLDAEKYEIQSSFSEASFEPNEPPTWDPFHFAEKIQKEYLELIQFDKLQLMETYCRALGQRVNKAAGIAGIFRKTDQLSEYTLQEAAAAYPDIKRSLSGRATFEEFEDAVVTRVIGTASDILIRELPPAQRKDLELFQKVADEGIQRLTNLEKNLVSEMLGIDTLPGRVWRGVLRNAVIGTSAGILLSVFGASINPWLFALLMASLILRPIESASIELDRSLFGIEILVLRMIHDYPPRQTSERVMLPKLLTENAFFSETVVDEDRTFFRKS